MKHNILEDRSVIEIKGNESIKFLQNILTADISLLNKKNILSSALLSPQGKILFEMIIYSHGGNILIESNKNLHHDLIKKLNLYKLNSNIEINDRKDLVVSWEKVCSKVDQNFYTDPRDEALGQRAIIQKELNLKSNLDLYHKTRISLGIPEIIYDYNQGTIFPHEANLNDFNGVSLNKGCYIGQEIVSRMHFRGTMKKKFHLFNYEGIVSAFNENLVHKNKIIGTFGSHTEDKVLILIKLQELEESMKLEKINLYLC
ncbi:MAG: CAF17-like 4Fe-4S cluster assembly/insertion protein YgfZ [Alphaproteobacteria bacterium]|jgi:folate-binding protein YgfZ|tara:strand:- start:26905 stop:27678 length:774 start_codon:yes stop_codon:yes gene_type:complete